MHCTKAVLYTYTKICTVLRLSFIPIRRYALFEGCPLYLYEDMHCSKAVLYTYTKICLYEDMHCTKAVLYTYTKAVLYTYTKICTVLRLSFIPIRRYALY